MTCTVETGIFLSAVVKKRKYQRKEKEREKKEKKDRDYLISYIFIYRGGESGNFFQKQGQKKREQHHAIPSIFQLLYHLHGFLRA